MAFNCGVCVPFFVYGNISHSQKAITNTNLTRQKDNAVCQAQISLISYSCIALTDEVKQSGHAH